MLKIKKLLLRVFISVRPTKQCFYWGVTYGECRCGNTLEDTEDYCPICGAKVNWKKEK